MPHFLFLNLSTFSSPHHGIHLTRSLGYLIPILATSLDFNHFLSPVTDGSDQPIDLRVGVVGMKRQSDATLTFGNGRIFDGKGAKGGQMQVKDEPIAVSLAGPNGDDVAHERLLVPAFVSERDGQNAAPRSFLPDCVASDGREEVFDKTLNILLSLWGGVSRNSWVWGFLQ